MDGTDTQEEAQIPFKKKWNLIPFRCATTNKIIWPLQKVMIRSEIQKNYDGISIKRWKCSTEEYLMRKLQGKVNGLDGNRSGFHPWERKLSIRTRKSGLTDEKINRFTWCYRGKQDYWAGEHLGGYVRTEYLWVTEKEYMMLLMRNNE